MFYYTDVYKLSQIIHLQQDKYIIISFFLIQMTHNTYNSYRIFSCIPIRFKQAGLG